LNEYLNAETRKSLLKDRIQIKYEHLREKDSFYEIPESFLESLPLVVQAIRNRYRRHNPRLRVTTNQRTGRIKAQIIKFRVADLQISCPRNNFDVRISISLEVNYPDSTASLVEHRERNDMPMGRLKDRLSYKHQNVSVDLTQVTSEAGGNRLHELELELDTVLLVEQARLAHEGRPNDYERQVGVFMNYVRVINRACGSA
jgi:polynucleotide 5'-triphosphatase